MASEGLRGPLEEFLHTLLRDATSLAMDTKRLQIGRADMHGLKRVPVMECECCLYRLAITGHLSIVPVSLNNEECTVQDQFSMGKIRYFLF